MRFLLAALLIVPAVLAQSREELITTGVLALDRGQTEVAYEKLASAVKRFPGDARALIGLAEACRRLERFEEAEQHVEAAKKLASEQPALFRGLSIYYENGGQPGEAARAESYYARSFPDDFSGFARAAALYLAAGDANNSVEFARSGLERRNSAPLQNTLGKALAKTGDETGAEAALLEAIRLAPYDEEYRYDLGYLHLLGQRYDRAVEVFEEGRKVFDKSARIEMGMGIARYGQQRFADAVSAFLRATDLAPDAPQPHYLLGRTLQHATGRIDEVLARQKRFAELQPDGYLGSFLHAQALIASLPQRGGGESLAEAERLLRRSIAQREEFWESHFALGVVLERLERFDEAARSLERAVALNDASSKPHDRLARVYARLGRREDAAREREIHQQRTEAERAAMGAGMRLDESILQ